LNFENYFNTKAKLFDMCSQEVINIDDQYGLRLKGREGHETISFGIENHGKIYAKDIDIFPTGTRFNVVTANEIFEVNVPIPGKFSVYNALAAISACQKFKVSKENIIEGLKNLKVPGRAETVETNGNFAVVVDYAHSPDSLKNILQAVKIYAKGRIVVIFGCGGDRDRTKRPIMGEIAGKLADVTILTSDNPRSEDPDEIIVEIEEGIKKTPGEYIILPDRRMAIEYAIRNSKEKDIILIAGKGHETYQIFKDKTIHFDDREVAREAIAELCS
jgi:UDP-N-acetylmuramoyl-L-alanyl-D-glutamate--2,6-diaminopimelate ligase